MDDDAVVLVEVRRILDRRLPAEETIRAIKRLVQPQRAAESIDRSAKGWPVLRASSSAPATVWERHDDPEMP